MENYTELVFNSPTGPVHFNIDNHICIDPNTKQPYKYAIVHGNSWQTTLYSELPKLCEAYTPSACPELNHRGLYIYNPESKSYSK